MREVADEELLSRNVSGCPLCRFSLEREEEETDVRIIGGQRKTITQTQLQEISLRPTTFSHSISFSFFFFCFLFLRILLMGKKGAVGNIETPLYQRNEHASPGTAQRRRNRISGIPETHVCDFVTQKYLTPFDERTLDFVSPSLSCPWSTRVEPFSATSPLVSNALRLHSLLEHRSITSNFAPHQRNLDGLHVEALLDKPAYHPGDLVRGIIKLYVVSNATRWASKKCFISRQCS